MAGLVAACGHFGFVDLPLDGEDGGPLVDGGLDVDLRDANAADSADGGCVGPTCPGIYVSESTGGDTNPGTSAAPVKTITMGIALAAKLGAPQNVYIAGGHYLEKVTLSERIDLLGGHDCSPSSCTWLRDIKKNVTSIDAKDFEGVLAPHTITRRTLVDGLWIAGKEGAPLTAQGSVALTLDGATPTIKRCTIAGAKASGAAAEFGRSIGVEVLAPSNAAEGALFEENTITAGDATEDSIAVLLGKRMGVADTAKTVVVLTGNTITSGNADFTAGVRASNTAPATLLRGNDITSGTSTGGGNGAGSWGISVSSAMTIDANRINVDQAKVGTCPANGLEYCGGIQSLSSTTFITNNVVFGAKGPRTCAVYLREADVAAGSVVLNANTLDGAGVGVASGGLVSTAIALRSTLATNAVIGSVRNNILLGGINKYRYGVYEESTNGKTARTAALENNAFWNYPPEKVQDFAYRRWNGSGGQDLEFGDMGTVVPTPIDNINQDPLLTSKHGLEPNSPCVDKGTAKEAPTRDIDGDSRPKGAAVDIGADESR